MTTSVTLTSYVLSPWNGSYHGGTSNLIELSYADLDFSPSAADSYKSTSGDVFKVFVDGVRIYRRSDQTFASGEGFREDGDSSNGTTLNGKTGSVNGNTVSWDSTTDDVWTIDTANRLILLNKTAVAATDLYGNGASALNVGFSANSTIITLTRAVQDLKTPAIDFSNASILTEQDLDNSAKNVFHASQQAIIATEDAMLYDSGTDTYNAYQPGTTTNKRIANVADPVNPNDVVNKNTIDNGIGPNITTVAGISSEVTAVAGKVTELTRLGTTATVEDMGLLGTADCVADMAILGTTDTVADLAILGTTDVVADLNTLGTADIVTDMNLLATSSNVAAMALLGTSDAVADMNTLGTSDIVTDMNLLATTDNVSNMDTCADNITNVNAVAGSIAGSLTYAVTVAAYSGSDYFYLDGIKNPTITLTRGFTYTFDQSAGTNSGHLLLFKDSAGNAYTNGVTSSGTLGQAGAKTVFVVPANAPDSLRYYCSSHGNNMGNTITVVNNDIGTVASIGASNLNTVATNAESTAIVMGIALG